MSCNIECAVVMQTTVTNNKIELEVLEISYKIHYNNLYFYSWRTLCRGGKIGELVNGFQARKPIIEI